MKNTIKTLLGVMILVVFLTACGTVVQQPVEEEEAMEIMEEPAEEETVVMETPTVEQKVVEEVPEEETAKEVTIEKPEEMKEESKHVSRWYFTEEEIVEIQKDKMLQGTKVAIPDALQKLKVGESFLFAVRLVSYETHKNHITNVHVKNVEEKIGMSFHPVPHDKDVVKKWIKTDDHLKFQLETAKEIVVPLGLTVGRSVGEGTETQPGMRITYVLDFYEVGPAGEIIDGLAKNQEIIIRVPDK